MNEPNTPGDALASGARERLSRLATDPGIFAHTVDVLRQRTLMVRLQATDFAAESFLDDRVLNANRRPGWLPNSEVAVAADMVAAPRSLHFIFHAGHVGSTLLSRLCDDLDRVLSIREPQMLRTLAELADSASQSHSLISAEDCRALITTHVRLWRRGYDATEAVVLKATSAAARLGSDLMRAADESRAVYLTLAAEPFLATLLAGANSWLDLRGHGPERMRRLTSILGPQDRALHALTPGELAALSWLVERLTQARLVRAVGDRVLSLDFEAMLRELPQVLASVCVHFGLARDAATITRIATGPTVNRYAKAPEHSFSAQHRAAILAQSRRDHADEIARGLRWLEGQARAHTSVAALLAPNH